MTRTTLVTCFFSAGFKSVKWDPSLMEVNSPLVIYGDHDYINYAKQLRGKRPTIYIPMRIEELPLWSYYRQVEENRKKSWPTVDDRASIVVHLIACSKIYLVANAIKRNLFKTDQYAFIDCNLLMKTKIDVQTLDYTLEQEVKKFHIMAVGVINDNLNYEQLYSRYRYVVSGGFFISDIEHTLKVKELFHQEFVQTTDAGYGHNEEMIYIKLIRPYWHLFRLSYGDYTDCLTNIFNIKRNHEYVYRNCILRYANERFYPQLEHCSKILLESDIKGKLRFNVLYYLYISYYWQNKKDDVIRIVNDIAKVIRLDHDSRDTYMGQKDFYITNLNFAKPYFDQSNLVFPSLEPLTLCLAIPCYKPHLSYLKQLIEGIKNQTRKPDQVIIISSETQLQDIGELYLEPNWSLCITPDVANASMNRNRLIGMTNCDIISFIDADDQIHMKRIEFIIDTFEQDIDLALLLHSFSYMDEPIEYYDKCPTMVELRLHNNYLIPITNQRIHNGHASFRRSYLQKLQYKPELRIGEDVDLNIRFFKENYKIKYIPAKLSIYNKDHQTVIYGRLVGGLGNQLFIIAKTIYEAHRTNAEYKFIKEDSTKPYLTNIYSKFIDRFVDKTKVSNIPIYKEKQWTYYDTSYDIDTCFSTHSHLILEGYWQSEMHFPRLKDELLNLLGLDNEQINEGCLIMIRRGDYLKYKNIHNPCNLAYYRDAIQRMKEKGITKFYITSDDMSYCKEHFPEAIPLLGDDIEVLRESIRFKYYILSNSTYHWFASYFAKQAELVIVPDQWITLPTKDGNCLSIYRDDMTIIHRDLDY